MTKENQENPLPPSGNELGNMEYSSDSINNWLLTGERIRTAQAPPPFPTQPLSLPLDIRHPIVGGTDTRCTLDGEGYCITCSDEAVQVRVLSVDEENGLALVTLYGTEEEIDVTLVEHIAPGDVLLVHGGVAIAHVDEESDA